MATFFAGRFVLLLVSNVANGTSRTSVGTAFSTVSLAFYNASSYGTICDDGTNLCELGTVLYVQNGVKCSSENG